MPHAGLSFGQWVRQQRKLLNLTQESLGLRVVCSPHTIRKIEADERHPSRRLAARLAEHLLIAPAEQDGFRAAARGIDGSLLARAHPPADPPLAMAGLAAAGALQSGVVARPRDEAGVEISVSGNTSHRRSSRPFIGRERECRGQDDGTAAYSPRTD